MRLDGRLVDLIEQVADDLVAVGRDADLAALRTRSTIIRAPVNVLPLPADPGSPAPSGPAGSRARWAASTVDFARRSAGAPRRACPTWVRAGAAGPVPRGMDRRHRCRSSADPCLPRRRRRDCSSRVRATTGDSQRRRMPDALPGPGEAPARALTRSWRPRPRPRRPAAGSTAAAAADGVLLRREAVAMVRRSCVRRAAAYASPGDGLAVVAQLLVGDLEEWK